MMVWINQLQYDQNGLIPAIIQDACTSEVLMMAYMNRESLKETIATGETCFFSRSRQTLWHKGESSGHIQHVLSIDYDCDGDCLLIKVNQKGAACHTGERSCFFQRGMGEVREPDTSMVDFLPYLESVIEEYKHHPQEGSYTSSLLSSDIDRVIQKVGEEAIEVIIAAKSNDNRNLILEISDLWYHCLVLMASRDLRIADIANELLDRHTRRCSGA